MNNPNMPSETKKTDGGEYYFKLSGKFKIAKYVSLAMLLFFILFMISIFREDITIENFQYMIKYIDTDVNEEAGEYRTISYDAVSNLRFAIYRGDLVTVKNNSVTMYSFDGTTSMTADAAFSSAQPVSSDKYMLVYDLGHKSYSLYNSFSKLYTETLDYPISCAAVSSAGVYAIATKTLEYRCAVYIYDKNFKKIAQILKDKYVMDLKLSEDGKRLLLLCTSANQNGEYVTEILNANPYSDTDHSSITVNNTFPISSAITDSGNSIVLGDNKIMFFDKDGTELAAHGFGQLVPVCCDMNGDYAAVAFNKSVIGYESDLCVYNGVGDEVYRGSITGQIGNMKIHGNYIFIRLGSEVIRIGIDSGETVAVPIEKSSLDLLCINDDRFAVCYADKTLIFSISDYIITEE